MSNLIPLDDYFNNNFGKGNRFDLVVRLAGSCVYLGVDIDDCIEFYKQYRNRDDEDRTYLIRRTYERFQNGKKVITLPKNIDVKGYFKVNVNNIKHKKYTNIDNLLSVINSIERKPNYDKHIDLDSVSVKPDIRIHKKEIKYLLNRKITYSNIKQFNIRVGINDYQNRVIFPCFDDKGNCIYFTGRAILNDIKPRYKNAKVERGGIIWNYYNVDYSKPVYICEGIINAISLYNYTGYQVVATLSKYLTEAQIIKLSIFEKPVFAFDGDVDIRMVKKYIKKMNVSQVKIIQFPEGKDINDMERKELIYCLNNDVIKINKELDFMEV